MCSSDLAPSVKLQFDGKKRPLRLGGQIGESVGQTPKRPFDVAAFGAAHQLAQKRDFIVDVRLHHLDQQGVFVRLVTASGTWTGDVVDLLDVLAGIEPTEVIASGGGFESPLWRGMHAQALHTPLRRAETPDGTARGAAIIAALGVGALSADHLCPPAGGTPETPGEPSQIAFWDGLMRTQAALHHALSRTIQNI